MSGIALLTRFGLTQVKGDADPHVYAVFKSNDTWNWTAAGKPATVDLLIVGGGGAGGFGPAAGGGGGGGAGEVKVVLAQPVSANTNVIIGNGGSDAGLRGGYSRFGSSSLQAEGGAYGGRDGNGDKNNAGGSGGGGSGSPTFLFRGGGVTAGRGNVGGDGTKGDPLLGGGGGGGAASAGSAGSGAGGGPGGDGISLAAIGWSGAITAGAPPAVGGGGGGGSNGGSVAPGGLGGGGDGGTAGVGSDAAANTGGGGGGRGGVSSGASAKGGTGLVVVRWIP